MWILADIAFLVGFVVFALVTAYLIDRVQTWWYDSGHPCTCKRRPDGSIDWLSEGRDGCPRHNPVTSGRFDAINGISILIVAAAAFVATLECHRLFAWWH